MPLNNIALQNAKPKSSAYKLTDGEGMFLLVSPTGSRSWRLKYRFDGKEKALTLGTYPEVSLAEAREKRFAARKQLQAGIDPGAAKQEKKREAQANARNTFVAVAQEWHTLNKRKWSAAHAQRLWRRLEMHAFPMLGKKALKLIRPSEVMEVIRKVEANGTTDMSHCVHQTCSAVFRHAIATDRAIFNPAASLQGALQAHVVTHFPSIQAKELPAFFTKLGSVEEVGQITKLAIRLLVLTFVRQGELRRAKWSDIDLEALEWRIPAENTKMRTLHIVPLAKQVLEVLAELRELTGGDISGLLFPNQQRRKNPMMSENTINHALKRMGYGGKLVGHGFRSLASTTLNEMGFKADVIERQLAHMERDAVRAAYNYAQYMPERMKMMQRWADYLQGQATGGNIVTMKRERAA